MSIEWFPRATPPHPETTLRIETLQLAGKYGRFHVRAFDGDRWIYSAFYDCHRWDGHCGEPPPPEPNKTAVAADLKRGTDVPGCRLTHGVRLAIE